MPLEGVSPSHLRRCSMPWDELIIEGARQNNLKNITLRIPHDKFVVVTGVSGSGKSSLAFDTIFAEGQWRFIESLSTYARIFIEKLDRPDVDGIYNIRPAIALEQKNPVKGSRSTVGTLTELYDLLRVLYSKIARPFCPVCNREIIDWNPSSIKKEIINKYNGERAFIMFGGEGWNIERIKREGFQRIMTDEGVFEIDDINILPDDYRIIFDRIIIEDNERLSDSIEGAWRFSGNNAISIRIVDGEEIIFRKGIICDICGFKAPEPSPLLFSFNHPLGACPQCRGFGNILEFDEDLIIPDKELSLEDGAIEPFEKPSHSWWKEQLIKGAKKKGIPVNIPYRRLSEEHKRMLFEGEGFYGIKDFFEEMEYKRYKIHVRVFLSRYRQAKECPSCNGKRLKKEALSYRLNGMDIGEISSLSITKLKEFMENLKLSPEEKKTTDELMKQIIMKLNFLERVGLGYLTLSRQAKTLSGGEYQRANLSNQLGSQLTGTIYVLDEPTVGLHPVDTEKITDIIRELADLGNTVIVVEHDKHVINSADWIVELGPGGGYLGGDVVFNGPKKDFLKADTPTSRALREKVVFNPPPFIPERFKKWLFLKGASGNNLKNIDVKIPINKLTVVTGVSGSGKSTLIVDTLYRIIMEHTHRGIEKPLPYRNIDGIHMIKEARLLDQSALGRTPRANILTYLRIFEPLRKIYSIQTEAVRHNYGPGFFSFNVPGGRCERCRGEGFERLELYFFEDVYVRCPDCKGKRYKEEVLSIKYRGKNIAEVMEMTVDEAFTFFSYPTDDYSEYNERMKILSTLHILREIGLGYLRLGQPLTTLSGGEAQRLKICSEIKSSTFGLGMDIPDNQRSFLRMTNNILYILDEPTVGLHSLDVKKLLKVIRRLIEHGNTVIIIEHNLDLILEADWIIDLGPEGGDNGGHLIYQGPLKGIMDVRESHTGRVLREYIMHGYYRERMKRI